MPREERRVGVQEGAKRGVRMGVRRVWLGSMVLMWVIVALVASREVSGEASV